MDPARIVGRAVAGTAIGFGLGFLTHLLFIAAVGPLVTTHLPPGNGRALYLLTEFFAGGAVSGTAAGLAYGVYEQRPARRPPQD